MLEVVRQRLVGGEAGRLAGDLRFDAEVVNSGLLPELEIATLDRAGAIPRKESLKRRIDGPNKGPESVALDGLTGGDRAAGTGKARVIGKAPHNGEWRLEWKRVSAWARKRLPLC